MITKTYCMCESCKQPILNREEGYIVQGNIYVADPDLEGRGGLIGNNIKSNPKQVGPDVAEQAFCKWCLLKALNIDVKEIKREFESLRGV